ncbi:histidine phosphatase family protein [Priestia taiwanensis]|uniref:Phosphoglycerate mutase n=1 Tax=Priestia taiwanensis TaxID=1347902 RepID=A0A917END1_9BACI|nr:histidine phosphatase family protein [Priestia taiwanensis]MBM7362960.1 putative phosphatase [Priestia taiwanensis]GGE66472.1 phosphoglycerate mutase [Priestia taiwanensis]
MTEICLVRHGQTDWNFQEIIQGHEDIPLNEVGKQQARQSAEFLSEQQWDIVMSSPLGRAYETAKTIADAVGIDKIILDERFIERNFGEASGKPIPDVRHLIAEGTVEGLETEEEIVARCFQGLQDVAATYAGKRIVLVAHSHAIKAILHAIAPQEITFSTRLANAGANFIQHVDGEWEVVRYNVAEHIRIMQA